MFAPPFLSEMFKKLNCISSVQFSRSVVSDSLRPHESQHSRPPCPSPTLGVYSNSCPLSRWCHPAIWSSVVPFSSCPQSLPASGSFPTSQLVAWGGQSIGVSASATVLPMNTQDWFPLGWTGWISLPSKGLSRVFSNTTVQKHQFFGNCSTILCWLLSYSVNQPQGHTCLLPSECPRLPHPTPLGHRRAPGRAPCVTHGSPLAGCFTHGYVYMSRLLS